MSVNKTLEEIVSNCVSKLWSEKAVYYTDLKGHILSAINEALEQEQNRTCEWVAILSSDGSVYEYIIKCDGRITCAAPRKFCCDCGGKVTLKNHSGDANEMGEK